MRRKRILILNTGGTISCIKTARGYEPAQAYMDKALMMIPALRHEEMPDYVLKEYRPLLDSSNIGLPEWNRMASDIASDYAAFDGFVIFHGTDTMAYTGSALSFMLENLHKPVILTGSQIPLSEVRNDAVDNIVTSLWLCAHQPINEVCIYFNQTLLRANRARKISVARLHAFDSPNFQPLASIGTHIDVHRHVLLPPSTEPFSWQPMQSFRIANSRLFPGFSLDVLSYVLEQPLQALVLETYGTGNAPNNLPAFLSLLRHATARDVLIMNCTQCVEGSVEMSQYATGYTLKEAGLISGHDMTPEAVHCKLLYLFSKGFPLPQIRRLMETSLRGELNSSPDRP